MNFDSFGRPEGHPHDRPIDLAFLWIGTNDVYVKVSFGAPVIKTLLRLPWAKNHRNFAECYRAALELLLDHTKTVITVPPLFMGEDIHNEYNCEFDELAAIIEKITSAYGRAEFFDLRAAVVSRTTLPDSYSDLTVPAGARTSEPIRNAGSSGVPGYLPRNPIRTVLDALFLRRREAIDKKASERGLRFTLDGVHLNGRGADLLAGLFFEVVEQHLRGQILPHVRQ